MTALGNNAHIFAKPHRRQDLAWCFETALGCPVATVEYRGIAAPMLVVRFPGGGSLSVEFTDEAPDDDHPRLGAWLELRAENPAAVMRAALDAGLTDLLAAVRPVPQTRWQCLGQLPWSERRAGKAVVARMPFDSAPACGAVSLRADMSAQRFRQLTPSPLWLTRMQAACGMVRLRHGLRPGGNGGR